MVSLLHLGLHVGVVFIRVKSASMRSRHLLKLLKVFVLLNRKMNGEFRILVISIVFELYVVVNVFTEFLFNVRI